jgi:alanyl-tRNA synthetase
MLFGEKYPDPVRMVSMGDFSRELCGGTHLTNTAEVDVFEIVSEEGISAGVRRIVALTGTRARAHAERTRLVLAAAAKVLNVSPLAVPAAVRNLSQRVRDLKKQLATGGRGGKAESTFTDAADDPRESADYQQIKVALHDAARVLNVPIFEVAERVEALQNEVATLAGEAQQLADAGDISADSLLDKAETIAGATVVVSDLAGGNSNLMRQLIDQIRKKAAPCAVLLAAAQGTDKVTLVAGVSRDLVDRGVNAGQWVREVAPVVGGGGGGKPDMAQAGGKSPAKVPDALTKAREVITGQLSASG